jgi:hypothetical protein
MVFIVVSWLCRCGARLKVIAEANENECRVTHTVSCPHCGELQSIKADRIVSVAETSDPLMFSPTNEGTN